MALETRTTLSQATIDSLQDLIQINVDSQKGFTEAAEEVEDVTLESLFRELARQRADQAAELQGLVAGSGAEPQKSGSAAAAVHRAWMDLRTALGGGASAILSEAERGEDQIMEEYEEALGSELTGPVRDVLNRHYAAVRTGHDRVRDLRDEYQS